MRYLQIVLFFLLFLLPGVMLAQPVAGIWEQVAHTKYNFIHDDEDVITRHNKLDSFFHKLQALKHTHKGRVSIIHIGDSHLQADGLTSIVRVGCQQYFGDAGRGLVFPYQLANSNAPHDIKSSSNVSWKSNRLTSPDKPVKTGISGYGIHSSGKNAYVNIQLKEIEGRQDSFNRMVFFLCNDSVCYRLTDSSLATPLLLNTPAKCERPEMALNSDKMLKGFELCKVASPGESDYSFYGVSLEKRDAPGVLYHTIGVNGARYDQFLQNDLFWQQLKALDGDLFIVSLGTNEAQNQSVNQPALIGICDSFVKMVHRIAPHACVLLTTPAGSYYRTKKPNKSMQSVSDAISKFTADKGIALWDLFNISGGFAGSASWKKYDLLSHDGVHYNNAGYQLQGTLLLNAFADGYNTYEKLHPYTPPKPPKPAAPPKTSDIIIKPEIVKKEPVPQNIPSAPQPQLKPKVYKSDSVNNQLIGPPKRKSNIVVEYSD